MDLVSQLLIALVVAVLLPITITFFSTRYNTDSLLSFVWGNQRVSLAPSANLITSTAFAMNGILYFVWLGYWIGLSALILQLFWCGSYVLLSFYATKIPGVVGTLIGQEACCNSSSNDDGYRY